MCMTVARMILLRSRYDHAISLLGLSTGLRTEPHLCVYCAPDPTYFPDQALLTSCQALCRYRKAHPALACKENSMNNNISIYLYVKGRRKQYSWKLLGDIYGPLLKTYSNFNYYIRWSLIM